MLATTVQLYDIDDVEGFVCATIERAGLGAVDPAEKEELTAEGLVILYRLAERFEPHLPGYSQPGRFSGFAAKFLPRRLGDTWHKSHPEHTRAVEENGKRAWQYKPAPISLDGYLRPPPGEAPAGGEARIRPAAQMVPVPLASARRP